MWKRMERRWTQLLPPDVQWQADNTPPEVYTRCSFQGPYTPALSDALVGMSFRAVLLPGRNANATGPARFAEGVSYEYRLDVTGLNSCTWSLAAVDGDAPEPTEGCLEVMQLPCAEGADERIFFAQYHCKGSKPPCMHMAFIDLDTGLITLEVSTVGVPASAIEVQHEFLHGILDGYADPGFRHGYTEDLVGRSIQWTYDPKQTIRHIYTSPYYYTYIMATPEGKCWIASNPADFIRINDHVCLMSVVEERQTGNQVTALINTDILHDVVSFFGVRHKGMQLALAGAVGEPASPYGWNLCDEPRNPAE